MIHKKTEELIKQIDQWYDEDAHLQIIEAILALPEQERTNELLGQLAVAYNNLDDYDKAIEVLVEIKPQEEYTYRWQYRMGYALYYSAREAVDESETRALLLRAREAFGQALLLNPPEDYQEDCQEYLGWIEEALEHSEDMDDFLGTSEDEDRTGSFVGFVLLDNAQWDKEQFQHNFYLDWNLEAKEEDASESRETDLIFSIDGMMAIVSLMPGPVPNHEAEENAASNYYWPEAVETTKKHRAHLIVAVLGQQVSLLDRGKLFVKIIASCCKQQSVLGIYTSGTVFQPEFYREFAELIKEDALPVNNWIWFGFAQNENRTSAYTYGMDVFGKEEIEIIDSAAQPAELRAFLVDIVSYVLKQDVTLQDGETIGVSAEQQLPITRSHGIFVSNMSMKIGYDGSTAAQTEEISLLSEMRRDGYFPPFLVDKVEAQLQVLIDWLEDSGERDTDQVQKMLDEMTCAINDLQTEFDENDSEIETVARDSIAVSVGNILAHYGITIDLEEALRERDW